MPTIRLVHLAAGLLYREADYAIRMTSHCEVLVDTLLADCSQNCQSAEINCPTKFLAIQYAILISES